MRLENYDRVSVSKRNDDGKLPIEVLLESNKVFDRQNSEYIDCVFRLLKVKAHPHTLMSFGPQSLRLCPRCFFKPNWNGTKV